MIIKIFKISTMEMWTMRNKEALRQFVEQETNTFIPISLTIKQLIECLPIEDYHRVK